MDDGDIGAALRQINERLDYIEDHIADMAKWGVHLPYVPMGRADHRPDDPEHVPPEVIELARAGKKKDAIARYRALTGIDVEKAIAIVDRL